MAINLFGATEALLESDYLVHYTFTTTSKVTSAAITTILNRKAARISGLVDALGIAPESIDNTDEPISFQNLQDIVLCGTAASVAKAFTGLKSQDGIVAVWQEHWDEGVRLLGDTDSAKALLSDSLTNAAAGFTRTHIQAGNENTTRNSDIDVEDPIFTEQTSL